MSLKLGNTTISGVTTPINGSIAIGQIISSIVPLTDAGLHLLDGALIQGGGVYNTFVQYIANLFNLYPQCFTDETTWQNTVNSKGVCGKFVYNSTNNTVRLPKITGFIEGTVDSNALGELVEAGLPNITGTFNTGDRRTHIDGTSGAIYRNTIQNGEWGGQNGDTSNTQGVGFDASLSNSIYGNSSTVQPQSIKVFYYIVVATTTKTEIEVDIDEVITDLNSIDSNAVHKIGNETIGGIKTFNNGIYSTTDSVINRTTTQGNASVRMFDYNSAVFTRLRSINNNASTPKETYLDVIANQNGTSRIDMVANEVKIAGSGDSARLLFTNDYTTHNGFYLDRNDANALKLYNPSQGATAWSAVTAMMAQSRSQNGYVKYNNGLIIQWGVVGTTALQTATITFPIPFTSIYSQSLCQYYGSYTGEYNANALVYERTLTYMRIEGQRDNTFWIAIGF